MIDPSIWTNRKFLRLSDKEKILFIGLFSISDDYGKLWYDILSIKATIFPLDQITEEELSISIKKLHDLKLIVTDEKVIKIHGWKNHQSVPKPSNSSIPEPLLNYYSNDTEPLPNHYSSTTEPIPNHSGSDTVTLPSKERKKEIKKERKQNGFPQLTDKELSLIETKKLFDDNLGLFTHSEFNLINKMINEGKHLSASTRIYEKIANSNSPPN